MNNVSTKSVFAKGGPSNNSRKKKGKGPVRDRNPLKGAAKPSAAPVANSTARKVGVPRFGYLPSGEVVITHREFVQDLFGSVAFFAGSSAINPGRNDLFPWLSSIANNYESYRFERLAIHYETACATSTVGTVAIAVDFDPSDPAPVTKQQVLSWQGAVRCAPWERDIVYRADPMNLNKRKTYFVRALAVPAGADRSLYDTGNLIVTTSGMANSNGIGELWVDYTVRLMTPQLGDVMSGLGRGGRWDGSDNTIPFLTAAANNSITSAELTKTSTGATPSITTLLFLRPWSGIVSIGCNGTGLLTATSTGTTTRALIDSTLNPDGTTFSAIWAVQAEQGETAVFTINNTTITNGTLVMQQGPYFP